jgi:hypothetical protein
VRNFTIVTAEEFASIDDIIHGCRNVVGDSDGGKKFEDFAYILE